MENRIYVKPLPLWARIADALMVPVMYLVSGTFREAPQRTHRWNNTHLPESNVECLEKDKMVFCLGIASGKKEFSNNSLICHCPIFGVWRNYVVVQLIPAGSVWHIGWMNKEVFGVSRINLNGPVRVLVGPNNTFFFGVDGRGEQILIQEVAR